MFVILGCVVIFGIVCGVCCLIDRQLILPAIILSMVLVVVYIVFYFGGTTWFPEWYDRFYQKTENTVTLEPFDLNDEERCATFDGYHFSYWSDSQPHTVQVSRKNLYLYLSDTDSGYYQETLAVTKRPLFRFFTVHKRVDRIDLYLPEVDYQEFQSMLL